MKRIISLFLSIVMLIGALSVSSLTYGEDITEIKFGKHYSRTIAGDKLRYGFYLPEDGKIKAKIDDTRALHFYIYDKNYKELLHIFPEYNSVTDSWIYNESISLPKGKYYLLISDIYLGSVTYDFCIKYTPTFSKTSIKKLVAKDNAFKVTWTKRSNVSGYQIQYSRSSNMSKAKTISISGKKNYSKTFKKLKNKKKYYVRIRTYKTVRVNGKNKTYYSKWSSKKSVKTK